MNKNLPCFSPFAFFYVKDSSHLKELEQQLSLSHRMPILVMDCSMDEMIHQALAQRLKSEKDVFCVQSAKAKRREEALYLALSFINHKKGTHLFRETTLMTDATVKLAKGNPLSLIIDTEGRVLVYPITSTLTLLKDNQLRIGSSFETEVRLFWQYDKLNFITVPTTNQFQKTAFEKINDGISTVRMWFRPWPNKRPW